MSGTVVHMLGQLAWSGQGHLLGM